MASPLRFFCLAATAAVIGTGPATASPVKLEAVAVDPLIKVFQDSPVSTGTAVLAESARGEHATFQVVVTSAPVDIRQLRCQVTTFTLDAATGQKPARLFAEDVRFVGYVPTSKTPNKPAKDQLRPAPAMFPDPLLEAEQIDVPARNNQPVWVTVPIPAKAEPGDYLATATLNAKIFGRETSTSLPLKLKVYPATITDTRLNVTNWFQMWHHDDYQMPPRFSPEYFEILRGYIRNMVEHRQNWARVETLWVMDFYRDANGELQFDFTNFDKWVEILLEEGIEHIEGLQYAWRSGKWEEPYHVEVHDESDQTYKGRRVPADSPEAKEFYSQFFPALHAHLKEKGWLDKYVQHVGDEPVKQNADSYTTASQLLKTYAPGIPVMEACLDHNMVGAIDIWVPLINHLGRDFDFFQERMKAGDRVWMYTCVQPEGEYANRFIDLPLIKTRLLHWVNYRYDIEGYLHWGYNFWRAHPWDNASELTGLPGGDMAIVYPEKGGPGVVDSIRWEAMRDGIEDHELLSQLGEKNPEKAMDLAKRHVMDWDKYETDVETFRATRRELLEALSQE